MKKTITIVLTILILLQSNAVYGATSQLELTGKVLQEIVACSNELVSSTQAFTNTGVSASITPTYSDSVIKITFSVPRIDVGLIKGTHSERTAGIRIQNKATNYTYVGGNGFIMGLVLPSNSKAAAVTTASVSGATYYKVYDTQTQTFFMEFGPGIANLTEAKMRGDKGEYCLILQEMRPKKSKQASLFGGITNLAQAIGASLVNW